MVAESTTARAVGPGRALAVIYGFFALAAGARSAMQLLTRFDAAPLAYLLSAAAAALYLTGAVVIAHADRDPRLLSWVRALCVLELCGVAAVGTASLVARSAFPDATVWSGYGVGYGFVPALLPLLGFAWYATAPDR